MNFAICLAFKVPKKYALHILARNYTSHDRVLYKIMLNGTQLRYLKKDEADDERYSCRGLWISYEWYNLSKENSPTRVLLDEYGKGLYLNSETMSSVPDTWESQSSSAYCVEQFVISVAFYSMGNKYNRRNKAECFKRVLVHSSGDRLLLKVDRSRILQYFES